MREQLPLTLRGGAVTAVEERDGAEELPRSSSSLAALLSARVGQSVELVYTDNRARMLSFRERAGRLSLRLQRAFAWSSPVEVEAIAACLRGESRGATKLLSDFLDRQASVVDERERIDLRPVGRFHDLAVILAELNERYFHGLSRAAITWGSAGARRWRRSIQLGCYVATEKLIRIHPSLDQAFVPRTYVAWVVFHEMLHEVLGVGDKQRRALHPPEFGALEATYPDYEMCKRWEQENLHRLLMYRPPRKR